MTAEKEKNLQTIEKIKKILDNFLKKVDFLKSEQNPVYQKLKQFQGEYITNLNNVVALSEEIREIYQKGDAVKKEKNSELQSLWSELANLREGDEEPNNPAEITEFFNGINDDLKKMSVLKGKKTKFNKSKLDEIKNDKAINDLLRKYQLPFSFLQDPKNSNLINKVALSEIITRKILQDLLDSEIPCSYYYNLEKYYNSAVKETETNGSLELTSFFDGTKHTIDLSHYFLKNLKKCLFLQLKNYLEKNLGQNSPITNKKAEEIKQDLKSLEVNLLDNDLEKLKKSVSDVWAFRCLLKSFRVWEQPSWRFFSPNELDLTNLSNIRFLKGVPVEEMSHEDLEETSIFCYSPQIYDKKSGQQFSEALVSTFPKEISTQENTSNNGNSTSTDQNNWGDNLMDDAEDETDTSQDKNESEEDNSKDSPPKPDNLQQIQTKTIAEITTLLNQDPKVSNNDLSTNYQNWLEQIKQLTDITEINNLKDKIIIDIQAKREGKQKNDKVNDILQSAQEENDPAKLAEKLREAEKESVGIADTAQTSQKNDLWKALAKKDSAQHKEASLKTIEDSLIDEGISENELTVETKKELAKLKSSEANSQQIDEIREKIVREVREKGTEKKIVNWEKETELVLKIGDEKKIKELKDKLLKFISSNNAYYQTKKNKVESLIKKLENISNQNSPSSQNKSEFPWVVVVPVFLLGVLLVAAILIIKKRKRQN